MNRKIAIIFLCAIIKKKKERCELYYDLLTKNNQLILSAMSYRHQQLLWSFGLLGADGYCSVLPHQQTGKPCSHTHDEEEKKRSELNLTQWLQRLCACAHVLVYACILVCFHLPELDTGITGLRGLHSTAGCSEALWSPCTDQQARFVVIQTTVCRRRFKKTMLPSSEQSKYCRGF